MYRRADRGFGRYAPFQKVLREFPRFSVAIQCLEGAFDVSDKNYAFQPSKPLLEIFNAAEGLSLTVSSGIIGCGKFLIETCALRKRNFLRRLKPKSIKQIN